MANVQKDVSALFKRGFSSSFPIKKVRCSGSSCALYQDSQKLKVREGNLFMRGKYLRRRKAMPVELYLVPPMIIYGRDEPKVLHLNGCFDVETLESRRNCFVLKNKESPRSFLFECISIEAGHVSEWVKDLRNIFTLCKDQQLPDCTDFLPFEQAIDDFQEARDSRDVAKAQQAVQVMQSTLNSFLLKYEEVECLQRLVDKYQAWLECACERLQHMQRRKQKSKNHARLSSSTSEGNPPN